MKQLLIALTSIVFLASCKKDAGAEGSGYKSKPIIWVNGLRLDSITGPIYLGTSNLLTAKFFIDLKTNCNIYCNVTIDDLGPNENQSLGLRYSSDNIAVNIGPKNTDGSNAKFTLVPTSDMAQKVLSNYYELNIVLTGPDKEYYSPFKIHIKR